MTMPSLSRLLIVAVALLATMPAEAQTSFNVQNPTLVFDGQYLEVEGAPVSEHPFNYLYVNIPQIGTYMVSGHPFEGSRHVGEFNDTYLDVALNGHRIQLWSTVRMLSAIGVIDAFARLDRSTAQSGERAIISSSPIGLRVDLARAQPARGPSVAERNAEAARLEAERAAAQHRRDQMAVDRARLRNEVSTLQRQVDGFNDDENPLQRERERLAGELSNLRNARSQAEGERARLQAEGINLSMENEALESRVEALRAERTSLSAEVATLEAERDQVGRARERMTETDAAPSLPRTQSASRLARILRERDEAVSERDEYAVTTSAMRREMTGLEARISELEEQRTQLMTERAQLLTDREQMIQERDALHREAERLRNEGGEERRNQESSNSPPEEESPAPEPDISPAETVSTSTGSQVEEATTDGPSINLVDFDFDRLDNPREVQRFIDDIEFPSLSLMTRAAGEVLVLFGTDSEGWVVRTEIARPIGSGLDIIAEQIVRTMHFKLTPIEGLPAALRSQVAVAFNR